MPIIWKLNSINFFVAKQEIIKKIKYFKVEFSQI